MSLCWRCEDFPFNLCIPLHLFCHRFTTLLAGLPSDINILEYSDRLLAPLGCKAHSGGLKARAGSH
jgi:hypothetical protein